MRNAQSSPALPVASLPTATVTPQIDTNLPSKPILRSKLSFPRRASSSDEMSQAGHAALARARRRSDGQIGVVRKMSFGRRSSSSLHAERSSSAAEPKGLVTKLSFSRSDKKRRSKDQKLSQAEGSTAHGVCAATDVATLETALAIGGAPLSEVQRRIIYGAGKAAVSSGSGGAAVVNDGVKPNSGDAVSSVEKAPAPAATEELSESRRASIRKQMLWLDEQHASAAEPSSCVQGTPQLVVRKMSFNRQAQRHSSDQTVGSDTCGGEVSHDGAALPPTSVQLRVRRMSLLPSGLPPASAEASVCHESQSDITLTTDPDPTTGVGASALLSPPQAPSPNNPAPEWTPQSPGLPPSGTETNDESGDTSQLSPHGASLRI